MSFSNITPEGTRDLIFEEYDRIKSLEDLLCNNFEMLGFLPIQTPNIEFYDLFDSERKYITQENMLKTSDLDGRILVLRPDSTAPIARAVSAKLKNEDKLKIYYNQMVYKQHPNYRAMNTEEHQSGIEIIGGDGEKADLCALLTAFQSLKAIGKSFKIEIGHSGLLRLLLEDLGLSDNEYMRIKNSIASLNTAALDFGSTINPKALEIARILPILCGGPEALEKARLLAQGKEKAQKLLDYIEKLYNAFSDAGYSDYIMYDMGIVQKIDYYTGIVFRGYIDGVGNAVLSGGRYDSLYDCFGQHRIACGFAINVSAVADTFSIIERTPGKSASISCDGNSIANITKEIEDAATQGFKINIEI
ncbi:MAG: hypothetical protein A2Y17_06590 [Clostridiales bacterium GWF2_38_85]|nr:MAG: hypothetical protein A2Y17_06590 [Clostridiales bacterium GWF2_38_85]HBL84882.1 ATP phosphoribosyltransferase regulatory subunit [Clostridiales bacterium]